MKKTRLRDDEDTSSGNNENDKDNLELRDHPVNEVEDLERHRKTPLNER